MIRRVAALAYLGGAVSCTSTEKGQDMRPCIDMVKELQEDEPAGGYGHSAALVIAEIAGAYQSRMWWVRSETSTDVNLEIDGRVLAARFVNSHPNPDYTAHGIQNCYDRVEFDARVRFSSGDGAFAEDWVATFEADAPEHDIASLIRKFSPSELQGSYVLPGALDTQILHFQAVVLPNAVDPVPTSMGWIVFPEDAAVDQDLAEEAFWPAPHL